MADPRPDLPPMPEGWRVQWVRPRAGSATRFAPYLVATQYLTGVRVEYHLDLPEWGDINDLRMVDPAVLAHLKALASAALGHGAKEGGA